MTGKRFIIVTHNGDVSVWDTETDNAELFSVSFERISDAKIMERELDSIVSALNWQDSILKENNLEFP